MRRLLSAAVLLAAAVPAAAQKPTPAKAPPTEAKPGSPPLTLPSLSALAAPKPPEGNGTLKLVVDLVTVLAPAGRDVARQFGETLVKGTENLAAVGKEYDPHGVRAALAVIREQNQTIQAMHRAEAARHEQAVKALEAENKRLKEEVAAKAS